MRTVYLQGPPNAGKSALIGLVESLYSPHEIGRFGPQAQNSQFWLQDLYGKEIYVGDEARASQLNIQTVLLLLEGNPALETEFKYGGKMPLDPRPVILACNQDLWCDCQSYRKAIRARCLELRFTRAVPPGCVLHSCIS